MKKVGKLIKTILIIMIIINILFLINDKKCYAMNDVTAAPGNWLEERYPSADEFDQRVDKIVYLIKIVGILVSVGTLMVIGIKYMIGSIEEKAKYKQTLIPWIVGAILVFAMTSLPSVLYDISKGTFEKTEGGGGSSPGIETPRPTRPIESTIMD